MAVTSNYQFNFNGYDFGGTQYGVQILEIEGLESQPSLRVQDDSGGYRDGQFTGRDFLNGRFITMQLQVMNDGVNTMQTYLAALKNAFVFQQTGTSLLQFQLPGRPVQQTYGRVRKRDIKIDPEYVYGRAVATVELFCPDPRIYDAAAQGAVLTPGSNVGRIYNRTYNLVYNTPIAGSTAFGTFTNSGNVTVYPTITFNGAVQTPRIVNSTTGAFIQLNITTSSSDVLVIDPDLRTVTYNGNPARNLVDSSSTWFGFPPGTTTLGIVVATALGGTCSVVYRNGYV
jgi:hypothetical protein